MISVAKLDVRGMAAPEPVSRVFALLESLGAGQVLHVVHRFEPRCLFGLLREMDYRFLHSVAAADRVDIFVWRASDAAAEVNARRVAERLIAQGEGS